MTICLGKSCLFSLLGMSFVIFYKFVYVLLSLLVFKGGMWDLIVSIPEYFSDSFATENIFRIFREERQKRK